MNNMRPIIHNKFNYDHTRYGEINDTPSMTIPGDTMSLREMLDRYARGMALPERPQPYYNDKEILPPIASMDLVDREEYLVNHLEHISSLQQKLKDEETAKNIPPAPPAPPAPDPAPTPSPTPNPLPNDK